MDIYMYIYMYSLLPSSSFESLINSENQKIFLSSPQTHLVAKPKLTWCVVVYSLYYSLVSLLCMFHCRNSNVFDYTVGSSDWGLYVFLKTIC